MNSNRRDLLFVSRSSLPEEFGSFMKTPAHKDSTVKAASAKSARTLTA